MLDWQKGALKVIICAYAMFFFFFLQGFLSGEIKFRLKFHSHENRPGWLRDNILVHYLSTLWSVRFF